MPKKRGTRRRGSRSAKRASARPMAKRSLAGPRGSRRINIVIKNLILFVVLFILSLVIAGVSTTPTVDQLFWILAILTGFISVALLIVLLIFLFMRVMRK